MTVFSELKQRDREIPLRVGILLKLFETLYFASLYTEELRPILCYISYLDPSTPDETPSHTVASNRWRCARFGERVPLTIDNLVKLAQASDPRTSSFAVYHDKRGEMFVWGIIDQANQYYDFINYDADLRPERPGLFQANITGPGHVTTYKGYERIGELKANILLKEYLDVLGKGIVGTVFSRGVRDYNRSIRQNLQDNRSELKGIVTNPHWRKRGESLWLKSLCRLLLRTRTYRQGGAFLITSNIPSGTLKVKYNIDYDRLSAAIGRCARLEIEYRYVDNELTKPRDLPLKEARRIELFEEASGLRSYLVNSRRELDGAIWFVSVLSRVDGLVVMDSHLKVLGFGVEVRCPDDPPQVYIADDNFARCLREDQSGRYGTRHRSIMRFCWSVPGSIGLIVSQDGHVRVVKRINDRLIIWDQIQLQYESKLAVRRKKGKSGNRKSSKRKVTLPKKKWFA